MLEWLYYWMRAREGGKVWEKKEYFTPLVTTAGINPKYWMRWHQTRPPFDFTVIRLEALFPIYKLLHKLSLWTTATFSWKKKKKIFVSLLPFPLLFLPFSSDIFEEQRKGKETTKLLYLYLKQIHTETRLKDFEVEGMKVGSTAFAFPLQWKSTLCIQFFPPPEAPQL